MSNTRFARTLQVNTDALETDLIKEVKRNTRGKQNGETRRFPVVRLILALLIVTGALLLIFWHGSPEASKPADAAPVQTPEIVLKPLPDSATPRPLEEKPVPAPSIREDPAAVRGPVASPRSEGRSIPPEGAVTPKPAPPTQPVKPQYRKARLFFASVDPQGKIAMKSVIRPVPIGDSPLQETLESLLAGPTPQEINLGMLSMIPTGSRLLSAVMKKDVVVLDFNENFRYNKLGIEGQMAQLRQVVYAATEFSNVKKVQILIEGKKVDFLGADGIPIGKPLDRESLGD